MDEFTAIGMMALMKADMHAQEIKRLYAIVGDKNTSEADGVSASVALVKHGVMLAQCFDAIIAAGMQHARQAGVSPPKSADGAN